MPHNIYTDDGVLHENVAKVRFYSNAGKTQRSMFYADDEMPAVQDIKEVTMSEPGTVEPDDGFVGMRAIKVTVTGGGGGDHGPDDVTFDENGVIVDAGDYANAVHKQIPVTGSLNFDPRNMIYDSTTEKIKFTADGTPGYVDSQDVEVSRPLADMGVPMITGPDHFPDTAWVEHTQAAEASAKDVINGLAVDLGATYTGWACVRATYAAAPVSLTDSFTEFNAYFMEGAPVVVIARGFTGHAANTSTHFGRSGDKAIEVATDAVSIVGGKLTIDALTDAAVAGGAKVEHLLIPLDFTSLVYSRA